MLPHDHHRTRSIRAAILRRGTQGHQSCPTSTPASPDRPFRLKASATQPSYWNSAEGASSACLSLGFPIGRACNSRPSRETRIDCAPFALPWIPRRRDPARRNSNACPRWGCRLRTDPLVEDWMNNSPSCAQNAQTEEYHGENAACAGNCEDWRRHHPLQLLHRVRLYQISATSFFGPAGTTSNQGSQYHAAIGTICWARQTRALRWSARVLRQLISHPKTKKPYKQFSSRPRVGSACARTCVRDLPLPGVLFEGNKRSVTLSDGTSELADPDGESYRLPDCTLIPHTMAGATLLRTAKKPWPAALIARKMIDAQGRWIDLIDGRSSCRFNKASPLADPAARSKLR